ncbi:MAG: hypothetical protein U0350_04650 [Caldilineaceae bacterium]
MPSHFFQYVLAYLLWLITGTVAVIGAMVLRSTYQILLAFDFSQRYTARAVDDFSVLGLGIGLVALVIFVEHHYRTAVQNGQLWVRFCRLTFIELGLIALFHFVQFGVALRYQKFDTTTLLIGASELVVALIAGWLYRFLQQRQVHAVTIG